MENIEDRNKHHFHKIDLSSNLSKFIITKYTKDILKKDLINLYNESSYNNLLLSPKFHNLLKNTFINDYYPYASSTINTDEKNIPIIMGGSAFNMNIPMKFKDFMNVETDDIDIKIYTTQFNSENIKKKGVNLQISRCMSIFKYVLILFLFFLKQSLNYLIDLESEIFQEKQIPKKLENDLQKGGNIKHNNTKKTKKAQQTQKTNLIPNRKKMFGLLKNYKIQLLIKTYKGDSFQLENIDISALDYQDIYKIVFEKMVDIDILATIKVIYNVAYAKSLNVVNLPNRLTILDCKVIYANEDNPGFWSYYLMNKKSEMDKKNKILTLSDILKLDLKVSDVIDFKKVRNNCYYTSLKFLILDSVLMLSFAEMLNREELILPKNEEEKIRLTSNIVVSIGCIFKYYKYLTKFIRLHVFKKYYEGTLNKEFFESAKQLQIYIKELLNKETSPQEEISEINIVFKKILLEFHTNFFLTNNMIDKYKPLMDIIKTYRDLVPFINASRAMYTPPIDIQIGGFYLDNSNSILNNDTLTISKNNIITRKNITKKYNTKKNIKKSKSRVKQIVIYDDYKYDNNELDSKEKIMNKVDVVIDKTNDLIDNDNDILTILEKIMV